MIFAKLGLSDPNNVYSCKPEETCCTKVNKIKYVKRRLYGFYSKIK